MIAMLAALALAQGPQWVVVPTAPTVGDTVRLVRWVPAGPAVRPRLQPLARSDAYEPLADPSAIPEDSTLRVTYVLAFFEAGPHTVAMPPLELRYPDGRTDVVNGDSALVTVKSVLPSADTLPPPKPSLAPIAREPRDATPLFALVLGVLALGGAWSWWRRRVRRLKPPAPAGVAATEVPLERWVAAGEARAVAAFAADRFRAAIAAAAPEAERSLDTEQVIIVLEHSRSDWPLRDVADVLRTLDRACFAPAVPSDVLDVVQRAERLAAELVPAASA